MTLIANQPFWLEDILNVLKAGRSDSLTTWDGYIKPRESILTSVDNKTKLQKARDYYDGWVRTAMRVFKLYVMDNIDDSDVISFAINTTTYVKSVSKNRMARVKALGEIKQIFTTGSDKYGNIFENNDRNAKEKVIESFERMCENEFAFVKDELYNRSRICIAEKDNFFVTLRINKEKMLECMKLYRQN